MILTNPRHKNASIKKKMLFKRFANQTHRSKSPQRRKNHKSSKLGKNSQNHLRGINQSSSLPRMFNSGFRRRHSPKNLEKSSTKFWQIRDMKKPKNEERLDQIVSRPRAQSNPRYRRAKQGPSKKFGTKKQSSTRLARMSEARKIAKKEVYNAQRWVELKILSDTLDNPRAEELDIGNSLTIDAVGQRAKKQSKDPKTQIIGHIKTGPVVDPRLINTVMRRDPSEQLGGLHSSFDDVHYTRGGGSQSRFPGSSFRGRGGVSELVPKRSPIKRRISHMAKVRLMKSRRSNVSKALLKGVVIESERLERLKKHKKQRSDNLSLVKSILSTKAAKTFLKKPNQHQNPPSNPSLSPESQNQPILNIVEATEKLNSNFHSLRGSLPTYSSSLIKELSQHVRDNLRGKILKKRLEVDVQATQEINQKLNTNYDKLAAEEARKLRHLFQEQSNLVEAFELLSEKILSVKEEITKLTKRKVRANIRRYKLKRSLYMKSQMKRARESLRNSEPRNFKMALAKYQLKSEESDSDDSTKVKSAAVEIRRRSKSTKTKILDYDFLLPSFAGEDKNAKKGHSGGRGRHNTHKKPHFASGYKTKTILKAGLELVENDVIASIQGQIDQRNQQLESMRTKRKHCRLKLGIISKKLFSDPRALGDAGVHLQSAVLNKLRVQDDVGVEEIGGEMTEPEKVFLISCARLDREWEKEHGRIDNDDLTVKEDSRIFRLVREGGSHIFSSVKIVQKQEMDLIGKLPDIQKMISKVCRSQRSKTQKPGQNQNNQQQDPNKASRSPKTTRIKHSPTHSSFPTTKKQKDPKSKTKNSKAQKSPKNSQNHANDNKSLSPILKTMRRLRRNSSLGLLTNQATNLKDQVDSSFEDLIGLYETEEQQAKEFLRRRNLNKLKKKREIDFLKEAMFFEGINLIRRKHTKFITPDLFEDKKYEKTAQDMKDYLSQQIEIEKELVVGLRKLFVLAGEASSKELRERVKERLRLFTKAHDVEGLISEALRPGKMLEMKSDMKRDLEVRRRMILRYYTKKLTRDNFE